MTVGRLAAPRRLAWAALIAAACLAVATPLAAVLALAVTPNHDHIVLGGNAEQQRRALADHTHAPGDAPSHAGQAQRASANEHGPEVHSVSSTEAVVALVAGAGHIERVGAAAPAPSEFALRLAPRPERAAGRALAVPHPPPQAAL